MTNRCLCCSPHEYLYCHHQIEDSDDTRELIRPPMIITHCLTEMTSRDILGKEREHISRPYPNKFYSARIIYIYRKLTTRPIYVNIKHRCRQTNLPTKKKNIVRYFQYSHNHTILF